MIVRVMGTALRIQQSAVAWKFASTALRFGGFVLILPITLTRLSPDELGMWYTMQAALGLTGLLDLGFSHTASRMASYLWGGAQLLKGYGLEVQPVQVAKEPNLSGLAQLAGTMRWFYLALGLVSAILLAAIATPWVASHATNSDGNFLPIWIFLLVACVINGAGSVWPNLLGGVGDVRKAEIVFFAATLSNYLVSAGLLLFGAGLWAVAIGAFTSALIIRFFGKLAFYERVGPAFRPDRFPRKEILTTIWPMAWRTGVVALSGYAMLYSSRIICATLLDLRTAASFGLTQQLFMAISQISGAWLMVKIPHFSVLRVQGASSAMKEIFIKRTTLSLASYIVIAVVFVLAAPSFLTLLKSKTELLPTALLAFGALIYCAETIASLSYAIVLTTNKNPFVYLSVAAGLSSVTAYWIVTPRFGPLGLFVAQACIGCAFAYWLPFLYAWKSLKPSK